MTGDEKRAGRSLSARKDGLDGFAEALGCHALISRALAEEISGIGDGTGRRNTVKSLADLTRYLKRPSGRSLDSREAAMRSLTAERSPLTALMEDLERIERPGRLFRHGSAPGDTADLLSRALFESFSMLERSARGYVAAQSSRSFSLEQAPSGEKREGLWAGPQLDAWRRVAEDAVARSDGVTVAAWPGYYHLYLFLDRSTDPAGMRRALDAASGAIRKLEKALFTAPLTLSSLTRSRVLPLPCSAITPLVHSCYLNNPFKYYDMRVDDVVARDDSFPGAIPEPDGELLRAMAVEAVTHSNFAVRLDLRRTGQASQVYRAFLRILRLDLFLTENRLIVPLAAVPSAWRESPGSEAVRALKREFEAGRHGPGADLFRRHYPAVKERLIALSSRLGAERRGTAPIGEEGA